MTNFNTEYQTNPSCPKVKVIGAGGAGGNAVDFMIKKALMGVEFITINNEYRDLNKSISPTKLEIGTTITRGLGSGGNPEIGRESALEDKEKIAEAVEGSDVVFIIAGMGGGTGTGSTPIIAELSKEAGALTIGVVTKPFSFEGPKRNKQAIKGIQDLSREVDTLIIIPNDKITENHKVPIVEAFKNADEALYQAVRGISDIITGTGYTNDGSYINVDFSDVKSLMSENGGIALIGTGYAQGSNRRIEATEMAITSPLLENISIEDAKGILLNVTASNDFGKEELNDVCSYIRDRADKDVNLIFGLVFDDATQDNVRITVITTGIHISSVIPPPLSM